jgi:hypothetical protein
LRAGSIAARGCAVGGRLLGMTGIQRFLVKKLFDSKFTLWIQVRCTGTLSRIAQPAATREHRHWMVY